MFDYGSSTAITEPAAGAARPGTPRTASRPRRIDTADSTGTVSVDVISAFLERLTRATDPHTDADRIDLIRALEDLKNTAAAVQARITVAFAESQEAAQEARRREVDELGKPGPKSIAAQVALARRESPHRGQLLMGLARGLTHMPHTQAAFNSGVLTELLTAPGKIVDAGSLLGRITPVTAKKGKSRRSLKK